MVDSILASPTTWYWVAGIFLVIGLWCLESAYAFWYEYQTFVIPTILVTTAGGAFWCVNCVVEALA